MQIRIFKIIFAVILLGMAAFTGLKSEAKPLASSKRADKAIAKTALHLKTAFTKQGHIYGSPVFLRIVKTTKDPKSKGYLDAFVQDKTGQFKFFRRWDICTWSGRLGPKLKQGDGQSPEGFYFVTPQSLNPNSSYHLSFNLGYPNAYDRAYKRTGDFLMVHGKCASIGCYAMTDKGIDEIYTLISAAFDGGQPFVRVHIFPFEMSPENLAIYNDNENAGFWKNLKQGWDHFETHKHPPNVTVKNKRYIFSAL